MPDTLTYEKLGSKYYVAHATTPGEPIQEDVFVLRPERDRAARKALMAYAQVCEDKHLRADLFTWLAHIARAEAGDVELPYRYDIPDDVQAALAEQAAAAEDLSEGFDPLGADGTVFPPRKQLPTDPPYGSSLRICTCEAVFFFGKIRRASGGYSNTPIDWPPTAEGGHLILTEDSPVDGKLAVRQASKAEREAAHARGEVLWTAHFSTCPDAARHRGGRG